MLISAKSDYAVRAVCCLALSPNQRVKAEALSRDATVPRQYLENIMGELKRAGLVRARRGTDGGYELRLDPGQIDIGTVLGAVGSSIATLHASLDESPEPVSELWLALVGTLRDVIERVTIADLVSGALPEDLRRVAGVERRRGG